MLVVTDLEGNPPKVYPIYAMMIWRVFKLRDQGDLLGAVDRLTTARAVWAELRRGFP